MLRKIPRKIHQIWFQGWEQLPEKYRVYQNSWCINHPLWDYYFWDEGKISKFILKNYPKWFETYEKFQYMHQKIDFFKYLILYDQGGIYADIDSLSVKPIDGLIEEFPNSDALISEAYGNALEHLALVGYSRMLNNGIIISISKHPFFYNLLEKIGQLVPCDTSDSKFSCIQKSTGPQIFTQECEIYLQQNLKPTITILPAKYLEPCYGLDKHCLVSPDSYANHLHSQSWLSELEVKFATVYNQVKENSFSILTVIALIFLYYNRKRLFYRQ